MEGSDSFDLYAGFIEQGTFLGKISELTYMLYMLEVTGRMSRENCEELLRLARVKERNQKTGPVTETTE